MKNKTIWIIIVLLASIAGVFAVACSSGKNDNTTDDTVKTIEVSQPGTPQIPAFIPTPTETPGTPTVSPPETPQSTGNGEPPGTPAYSPPETPRIIDDTDVLSEDTVRFAGVEGDFSPFMYYSENRVLYGNYYATLVKGKTSTLEFSNETLIIDGIHLQIDTIYCRPDALFIVDLDAADEYYEILIFEYGTNDWRVNIIYRYDGDSIIEVARFIGWAFSDRYGKLIETNNVGGNMPGQIADPIITRSYYELRNGKLEEIKVPIKGITFTFADNDFIFNFCETSNAPTPEFISRLIPYSSIVDDNSRIDGYNVYQYFVKDFAGQRFTILDYSEQEPWYRGAWYFVQLGDGRKGIIYWWHAM